MIDIDGILYDADDYYYFEHMQSCLKEEQSREEWLYPEGEDDA